MNNLYKMRALVNLRILIIGSFLLLSGMMYADGSKDLYPSTATGYRAYLRSYVGTGTGITENYPFPTQGTHYVYANVGERIAIASSSTGAIRLYGPNNTEINIGGGTTRTAGIIANRAQELAGPQLPGQNIANRYTALYYTVPAGGVYRVEMDGTGDAAINTTINATAEWTQPLSSAAIMAWDVSVINDTNTDFIKGRVYVNVFNMSTGTGTPQSNGFYGIFYVFTKDGYNYRVSNNGNNGMYFTFFVNNNGFLNASTKQPIYNSLNTSSNISNRVQDPRAVDTAIQTTHKIFYTLPATDLPTGTVPAAVSGGSTWLRTPVTALPSVSNITLIGVEGIPGQVSNKGGYVKFNASQQGSYKITIQSPVTPATFTTRILTGAATAGANEVLWDGRDGNNIPLPAGTTPAQVIVQLQGAEVHFPYIDMEYNKNGIFIELLDNNNLNNVVSDIVYWDDSTITGSNAVDRPSPIVNSHLPNGNGLSSRSNGHKYGFTGESFGNNKSIDTWAFVKGLAVTQNSQVVVKIADLKVSQLTVNRGNVLPGESFTATVKVKNDGPDAVTAAPFSFTLPPGFIAGAATFSGNGCGTQATAISYDASTRKYNSVLALPNGCEVTYTFTITVNSASLPTQGFQNFQAGILRQNDFTDPDATNQNPTVLPTDPVYECANNGLGGTCNNLKNVSVYYSSTTPCTEENFTQVFSATNGNSSTFTIPAVTYGAQVDIFTLDNSFAISVNGVDITTQELEFQSSGTTGINVQFADGTNYEIGTPLIYQIEGNGTSPMIRVSINQNGVISFFGSKVSNGPLFPLVLTNGNAANLINWNTGGTNTITVKQFVNGSTRITGRVSGHNIGNCVCYNPANTSSAGPETKVGITTLQRAGSANGNWPMIRQSGHIALESNSKGFVPTRVTTAQLAGITAPQEGMMVYDTTEKCLKIYADKAWRCFSTPACP